MIGNLLSRFVPSEQRADLRHRLGRFHPWETGFDFTVPPVPPGEVTGPPDFVGVGAPLSGVRWWSGLVADHPGVTHHTSLGVGRHYFSHFAGRSFGPAEVACYHGWFPRRPGTIAGEWTPTYLGDPWVPPLLAQAAPAARIIVMVRDPLVRLQRGLVASAGRRTSNAGAHMAASIDRSFYARPLQDLLRHVAADRILVLQFERCVAAPDLELASTYRFLGLQEGHRPARLHRPRPAPDPPPLDPRTEERLIGLYASDVADLAEMVPSLDLSLWPRFSGGI